MALSKPSGGGKIKTQVAGMGPADLLKILKVDHIIDVPQRLNRHPAPQRIIQRPGQDCPAARDVAAHYLVASP